MYKKVYLIVSELQDTKEFNNILEHLKAHFDISATIHSHMELFSEVSKSELYLLYLSDEDIKLFFQNHLNSELHIGIIPNEYCPIAMKNYAICKDVFEAIDDAFNKELLSKIDLLMCNELITFNRVTIGDMHGMNKLDLSENSRWQKIKIFFKNLAEIKFKNYTFITSKEHKIQTVASGITVLEHTIASEKDAISDSLSLNDGKLNAFILAPTSLISYIWYLILIFFYQKVSIGSLPKSLGFIKTSKLTISSDEPIEYLLDGSFLSSKEIELKALQDSINLHLGKALYEKVKSDDLPIEEKDSIKVKTLPMGEMNDMLIDKRLPLFKKASDDEFKDLFISIRNSAKFSYVYLTLMILSTLLATTGLFANSAPVIIGAMILAPLMAPIVSLAMGIIRAEKVLIQQSTRTLSIGIVMALLFSCVFTLLLPLHQITPEMQVRLNPNLLDLMVAIFSGMAGAYAHSKEEVAKSLAGVAIAVALVPPLSVTGIGIGLGNIDVIYGSFLLFITNLIGITLSAALTFIVLGFSPVKKAKKGLIYISAMMAVITVPLIFSFYEMVEKNDYLNKVESLKSVTLKQELVELNVLNIQRKDTSILINLETISSSTLSALDYQIIKEKFEERLKNKVTLEVVPKIIVK